MLIEEFLTARATRKPSPHTLAAYRRDLHAVAALVARALRLSLPPGLAAGSRRVSPRVMRAAFAQFADAPSAPASVHRAWSTWNSFFTFLVADGIVAGQPDAGGGATSERLLPQPKPLRRGALPEVLLASAARDEGRRRDPWPERDVAVLAVALCAGLRLSELLALRVGLADGGRTW